MENTVKNNTVKLFMRYVPGVMVAFLAVFLLAGNGAEGSEGAAEAQASDHATLAPPDGFVDVDALAEREAAAEEAAAREAAAREAAAEEAAAQEAAAQEAAAREAAAREAAAREAAAQEAAAQEAAAREAAAQEAAAREAAAQEAAAQEAAAQEAAAREAAAQEAAAREAAAQEAAAREAAAREAAAREAAAQEAAAQEAAAREAAAQEAAAREAAAQEAAARETAAREAAAQEAAAREAAARKTAAPAIAPTSAPENQPALPLAAENRAPTLAFAPAPIRVNLLPAKPQKKTLKPLSDEEIEAQVTLLADETNAAVRAGDFAAADAYLALLEEIVPPQSLTLWRLRAWTAFNAGRKSEARRYYKRILERLDHDENAGINLAILEVQDGNRELALRILTGLSIRHPDSENIRAIRQLLGATDN